jgi:phosphomannomutase
MMFYPPKPKSKLEKILLASVERDTPIAIKENPLIDLNSKDEFTYVLKREHLEDFGKSKDALGITSWFENYKKEAKVSTAGIRGLQNPLYPWDTRYPLNLVGVMLATMGKILVAKETDSKKQKIVACEVRYNSAEYVELIARVQAAYDIATYVTEDYQTIPIFMISFIIFMNDLYGGEYVTSSHAMCKKIATKDLNTQGSQYIPSESMKFVDKVQEILDEVKEKGEYVIKISSLNNPNINKLFLKTIKNGVTDYINYLRQGVATNVNIENIEKLKNKIIIDTVGGSLTNTFMPILNEFKVINKFEFTHAKEDPFNHGVGKLIDDSEKFFDWGCDATIVDADLKKMDIKTPVVNTVHYGSILKKYPIGTVLLITDPDADRLVTATVDTTANLEKIKKAGIVYSILDGDRILVMFTPNQSFLMTVDFQQKALSKAGLWDKYNWFILKTTASQRSWDEWAEKHNVPVINTPVGFKELADSMINIEKKLKTGNEKEIFLKDVFGNNIKLGKVPRMLFAGEESGGEIFGSPELIKSKSGRLAISMREKSAGEAIIITSAMVGWLQNKNTGLVDYLLEIFKENQIKSMYEIRIDQKYYNESESDIRALLREKEKGMLIKTKNNSFFLSVALGYKDELITLAQVKEIFSECFQDLVFSDLIDIKFCGDGTFIQFSNKCLETRPSGTDAVNKAYSFGNDQWECIKYAKAFASYRGERTPLHIKYIDLEYYNNIEKHAFEVYSDYKENQ